MNRRGYLLTAVVVIAFALAGGAVSSSVFMNPAMAQQAEQDEKVMAAESQLTKEYPRVSVVRDVFTAIKDGATAIVLVIGGLGAGYVFKRLVPLVQPRIIPTWFGDAQQFLKLGLELENKSKVRLREPTVRLQILEHKIEDGFALSEWVPFGRDRIKPNEQPIEWHDPVEIFESTNLIDPGEIIIVERLYHFPRQDIVVHIGLQVEGRTARLLRPLSGPQKRNWRWTTTQIVVRNGGSS